MKKVDKNLCGFIFFALLAVFFGGCVQRELTITTSPASAMVELNDEQIGYSPVTVPFNWYGVYRVRIEKEGYQTLSVNKELKRPAKDYFPLDLFRPLFSPRAVDSYQWSFELAQYQRPEREQLIDRAKATRQDAEQASEKALQKISPDEQD